MFATLASKVPRDKDLPERTWRMQVLRNFLEGTIYDTLRYSFQTERTESGEYIPLRDRRPSVRYNMCRMVVQDSVALLFGDGHFPTVELETPEACQSIADLIKETKLPQIMHEAAIRGSIGSIAVMMRVLNGRIFFEAMDTDFLTPAYDPMEPDTLLSVTERYKVKGAALAASGYEIDADLMDRDFWFQRIWDRTAENWFAPVPVATEFRVNAFKTERIAPVEPFLDEVRTVKHNLGFVPMVWIKNLPGERGIDGASTFRSAADTQIEIEYQLSQGGRGLKYSSDPLLMIREPASGQDGDGQIVRSPTNAIIVSDNGDAKMLEINGTAATAVIEYVRALRESAIETIHGNRSNADKVSAAQSGRALEMMHQPLIWLADQLRTSYGENGLLPLIRMVIAAGNKMPVKVLGKQLNTLSETEYPTLRWPKWFAPTGSDRQQEAAALQTLANSGHISRETAVKSIASSFDIEDIDEELKRILADEDAEIVRAAKANASVTATETLPS
jgi:hypothetical protein